MFFLWDGGGFLSYIITFEDEAGEWGEILDNRTGNGVLGAVVERRADVGISALYAWYLNIFYIIIICVYVYLYVCIF